MSVTAAKHLPFHSAFIDEEDIQAVVAVLRSGWLTTGPQVRKFEAAFGQYVGSSNAIALSSCTAALHLALAAIGLQEGDEVIVPTMTFSSTGQAVCYFGARPVLVDCESNSFQICPDAIERAITPRTRALIPVHYSGCPADLDRILDIARRHDIRVIEDAAHALPTSYRGKRIGSFSDVTCFSFYATKTITTGEGGMATTENPEYAERMRILRLHGISKDADKRYTANGSWRYEILEVGYKYNMTDMQAALGLTQLAKCDAMHAIREQLAARYSAQLATIEGFKLPSALPDTSHAWHLYVVEIDPREFSVGRDTFIEELKQRGIGTSVHFIPLHTHPLYSQRFGYRAGQFPNAERHFAGAISLPLYPSMTTDDVDRVVEALSQIAAKFRS
jgi:dTDP-4-amino-4,6-dideoxygalactose transaminase